METDFSDAFRLDSAVLYSSVACFFNLFLTIATAIRFYYNFQTKFHASAEDYIFVIYFVAETKFNFIADKSYFQ